MSHCPSRYLLVGSNPQQLGSAVGYVHQLARLAALANRSFVLPHIRANAADASFSPCVGQRGCNGGAIAAIPERHGVRLDRLLDLRSFVRVPPAGRKVHVVTFGRWARCTNRTVDVALHFTPSNRSCSAQVRPTLHRWRDVAVGRIRRTRCAPARLSEAALREALQAGASTSLLVVSWLGLASRTSRPGAQKLVIKDAHQDLSPEYRLALQPSHIEEGALRLRDPTPELRGWASALDQPRGHADCEEGGGLKVLVHARVEKLLLKDGEAATRACLPRLAARLVHRTVAEAAARAPQGAPPPPPGGPRACLLVATDLDAHGSATLRLRNASALRDALVRRLGRRGASARPVGSGASQAHDSAGLLQLARTWPDALVSFGTGAFSGWLRAEFGRRNASGPRAAGGALAGSFTAWAQHAADDPLRLTQSVCHLLANATQFFTAPPPPEARVC